MNEMFWLILILGILNFAILIANCVLIQKFKDFKDISELWCKSHVRQNEMHRLILKEYQEMGERYDSQRALFGAMCKQYETITDQYKAISKSQDEYRQLCKECVDYYGDVYEQFKLCSDKLDRIFQPQVSVSPEDFKADDEDIVI